MTDEQYFVKEWLNRMYAAANAIEALERKRELVVCSMSGIGKYDAKSFSGNNGENASETKLLEYSELCSMIDKKRDELSREDMVTLKVIDSLKGKNAEIEKAVLIDRYLNRLSWSQLEKNHNFERSRLTQFHNEALGKLYERVRQEKSR